MWPAAFSITAQPYLAWTLRRALPRMGAALPIHKGRLKTMRVSNLLPASALLLAAFVLPGCVITAVERVVEARSAGHIVTDNEIVIDVNVIMADLGTLKASTEIYEQRLLVIGLFDDKAVYDEFRQRVGEVAKVKALYWHVTYMSEADQASAGLLSRDDVIILDNKVGVNLISEKDIADVNFRVAADSFANVYLLGRARSQGELDLALAAARGTEGAKKVVNYVEVRP
jgi:hyperosmotically inducible protein